MFSESEDDEQIIERVAALDLGKAELVCCVRLSGQADTRRAQEVSTYTTMTRSVTELGNRLVDLRIERVVMEATSDYWKADVHPARGPRVWLLGRVPPSVGCRRRPAGLSRNQRR